jgi:hypothetical protein
MSENLKLGQIINEPQERDAIHVAVAPVVASELLLPGQHVALVRPYYVCAKGKTVGIIDPFLRGSVAAGEKCWLFLYPGSITALRHDWTHPAFEAGDATPAVPKAEAEKYLRGFAEDLGANFGDMIEAAKSGDAIWAYGRSISGWDEIEDRGREFWRALEIYTGQKFGAEHRQDTYFSCSC